MILRYGPTVRRECQFHLDEQGYAYWWQATSLVRRAEVVMVVQRADGCVLLHSKEHYPPATYRLPTGGIHRGESVLDALAREEWEELGLREPPSAMPGLVRYTLYHGSAAIPYASYVFVIRLSKGASVTPQDPCEAITDLCWVGPNYLPGVAEHLRHVVRGWGDWGPFRAIVHDLVTEAMDCWVIRSCGCD